MKKEKRNKRTKEKKKKATIEKLKKMKKENKVTHHPDGSKTIELGEETSFYIDEQVKQFKETFGREPEKGDPLFFDPDHTDKPIPLSESKITSVVLNLLKKAGTSEEIIYAYEQTGMLVTELNKDQWSKEDIQEWKDAIDSYRLMKTEMK